MNKRIFIMAMVTLIIYSFAFATYLCSRGDDIRFHKSELKREKQLDQREQELNKLQQKINDQILKLGIVQGVNK